jgi:hypothetical protein
MPASRFELELRHARGSELRTAAGPMNLGDEIDLDGTRWRVAEIELPRRELGFIVRYVCVDLRNESCDLRRRSKGLVARSRGLRELADRARRRL